MWKFRQIFLVGFRVLAWLLFIIYKITGKARRNSMKAQYLPRSFRKEKLIWKKPINDLANLVGRCIIITNDFYPHWLSPVDGMRASDRYN